MILPSLNRMMQFFSEPLEPINLESQVIVPELARYHGKLMYVHGILNPFVGLGKAQVEQGTRPRLSGPDYETLLLLSERQDEFMRLAPKLAPDLYQAIEDDVQECKDQLEQILELYDPRIAQPKFSLNEAIEYFEENKISVIYGVDNDGVQNLMLLEPGTGRHKELVGSLQIEEGEVSKKTKFRNVLLERFLIEQITNAGSLYDDSMSLIYAAALTADDISARLQKIR